jgi:hypothetical protein
MISAFFFTLLVTVVHFITPTEGAENGGDSAGAQSGLNEGLTNKA